MSSPERFIWGTPTFWVSFYEQDNKPFLFIEFREEDNRQGCYEVGLSGYYHGTAMSDFVNGSKEPEAVNLG